MRGPPASDTIAVGSTGPESGRAERIARERVESGLAACVTRLTGSSTDRVGRGWLVDEAQVILLVKTLMPRDAALEKRLKALLPDEVPEIGALPVQAGKPAYLSWLQMVVA